MSGWLAVDYGSRRIGLALGSPEVGIAAPLEVLAAEPWPQAREQIARTARRYDVEGIVVGLPLNMDGTEGPQAKLSRRVGAELAEATGLKVAFWDERLSSFQADRDLAGQYTRKQKKARQDAVAAAAFLQDFLDAGAPDAAQDEPHPEGGDT